MSRRKQYRPVRLQEEDDKINDDIKSGGCCTTRKANNNTTSQTSSVALQTLVSSATEIFRTTTTNIVNNNSNSSNATIKNVKPILEYSLPLSMMLKETTTTTPNVLLPPLNKLIDSQSGILKENVETCKELHKSTIKEDGDIMNGR